MNEDLTAVEFVKRCPPYHVGERAAFTAQAADQLVAQGVAKPFRHPKASASESQQKA